MIMDLSSIFAEEYYGNFWDAGVITWSIFSQGAMPLGDGQSSVLVPQVFSSDEVQILRQAFKLWDEAIGSIRFVEVESNSPDASLRIGLNDIGVGMGAWSASWNVYRTSASIELMPGLDANDFAAAAAHEIANVLGLGDTRQGQFVESLTSDPFSEFVLSRPNLNFLSRIDFQLIRQLYGEDTASYIDYLVEHGDFSQAVFGAIGVVAHESLWGTSAADLIVGYQGSDTLAGGGGDDLLDAGNGRDRLTGGKGDDLLYAGNGRDHLTGGAGADVMHGGFGANTFTDARDGSVDQIMIRSDQFIFNSLYGQAGNSPAGEKIDVIEGIDLFDNIFIEAGAVRALSVQDSGRGIGIYVDGFLEALYTGGDLTSSQLSNIVQIVSA